MPGTDDTPAASLASTERMSVVMVEDRDALAAHLPEWENLAASAAEPNVFYEPWMLLPALDSYGSARQVFFLLVYPTPPDSSSRPPLCGFFPMERLSHYKGLPIRALTLWKYVHCYLCTPLLRSGYVGRSLTAFFEWLLEDKRSAPIMEFPQVGGDGIFERRLLEHVAEHETPRFTYGSFTRALFLPRADGNTYLKAALSRKSRKELGRQEKRLSELGHLEYVSLPPDGDVQGWLEEFLRLEASGWKGRATSALACSGADRRFFLDLATQAFRRRRLMLLAMRLEGRIIALKCNLLAGNGSFAFKIAFDEAYARFSPGVLLELNNIRKLHKRAEIRWMDSCAVSDHFMANRLWMDRRAIRTILVATGRPMGNLLLATIPKLRWLSHKIAALSRPREVKCG